MNQSPELKRTLSLFEISLYGIGTILGAGIYVLLGKVAGESGMASPFAFLLAGIIVSFSAYSYSRLVRRFPHSAGEAVYIQEGLHSILLSTLSGYAVVFGGIVSSATLISGFTGYFNILVNIPGWITIIALTIGLTGLASWGIKQSIIVAVITTLLEITGLAMVIFTGMDHLPSISHRWAELMPSTDLAGALAVTGGAFLAFYAFIGFEDMVNMAEEVKQPERNLPLGIMIALISTVLIYMAVSLIAILSMPIDELAQSSAPLALIIERNSTIPPQIMAYIGMVAVVNGALVQIIMSSRVLYGMAKREMAPQILQRINPLTHTPIIATCLTGALVLSFCLWLPITALAKTTSTLVLGVFTLVNISLLMISLREKTAPMEKAIPMVGAFLCVGFILFQFIPR